MHTGPYQNLQNYTWLCSQEILKIPRNLKWAKSEKFIDYVILRGSWYLLTDIFDRIVNIQCLHFDTFESINSIWYYCKFAISCLISVTSILILANGFMSSDTYCLIVVFWYTFCLLSITCWIVTTCPWKLFQFIV